MEILTIYLQVVGKFVITKNCIVMVICLFRKGVLWMIIESGFNFEFFTLIYNDFIQEPMTKSSSMVRKTSLFCSVSGNSQGIPLLVSKILGKTQPPKVEIVVSEEQVKDVHVRFPIALTGHLESFINVSRICSSTLFACSALKIQAESSSISFLSNTADCSFFALLRPRTHGLCRCRTNSFLFCLSFSPARTRRRIIRSCLFATAFERCAVFWGGCLIDITTFI